MGMDVPTRERSNPGLGLFLPQFVANVKVLNGHLCLAWRAHQ